MKIKAIAIYIFFILFITILIPIFLTKGCAIKSPDISKEEIKAEKTVKVYDNETGKVEKMEFEEYIKGVVAAEMPAAFHIEALKAQSVAARTYAIYYMERYKDGHPEHPQTALSSGVECQAWLSKDELLELHSENWMTDYWPKISKAVEETKGEIITYGGKPIQALFHSTSGGKTEASKDVFASDMPYLKSVSSPYEDGAPKLTGSVKLSIQEFINILQEKYPSIGLSKHTLPNQIQLIERSEGGRVKKLKIDNMVLSGRDIRQLFNLNSTNFTISIFLNKDTIEINTIGYGHGVGMSQWGANGMAKSGSSYKDIIKHYYTGVKIENIY